MEVTFSDKKIAETCNSVDKLRAEFGAQMASKIMTRLADLEAVENLAGMRCLPGKCHELKENYSGHLGLHLVEPMRLVFRPTNFPEPRNESGTLLWDRVDKVTVVAITNYHKKGR